LDRPLADGEKLIRYDEIEIYTYRSSEPLALRTRAEGIIKREQARIGLFIPDAAVRTFEMLVEPQLFPGLQQFQYRVSIPRLERRFDGICQPGILLVRTNDEPVHEHLNVFLFCFAVEF